MTMIEKSILFNNLLQSTGNGGSELHKVFMYTCLLTKRTKKIIQKQKVPRKKISEGIPLAIYKRCGWEPPVKGLTEGEELNKRREFAIDQGASDQALQLLDKMSSDYEQSYGIWF